MSALPTETITFLFTDVVGSTRLWEQEPAAMRAALVQHDAIIEFLTERYHGQVVRPRGEGDSRFCVFARASDAVAAAAAIQRALHEERWPTSQPLLIRVALHTGEADLRDGDYYGSAVNRCTRLRAVAHGGQTLLSAATFDLVQDSLPAGSRCVDRGEHRLRDLVRGERIYELVLAEVTTEHPALKSLDSYRHNLPLQPTAFVGREREVAAALELLRRSDVRLLTLTGTGGTGKTRLALQVAAEALDDFEDGVWFVDLAPVDDPRQVLPAIARELGVPDLGARPLFDTLRLILDGKRLLMVLDNFEHVLGAAADIATLLAACGGVRALVTSRAALRVPWEHQFPVPALALPDLRHPAAPGALAEVASIALFVQRARTVAPEFALTPGNAHAVAEVCRRLDGLPLAIELAATRVRFLPPAAILAHLPYGLPSRPAPGRPVRHQTLSGAIAWSYDLLEPAEQALFRRLAVFTGGFTLEAVQAVCAPPPGDPAGPPDHLVGGELGVLEGLESLCDKSLVRQEAEGGQPRFGLLETIRAFAHERLDASGEAAAIRRRHAAYFAGVAGALAPDLTAPSQTAALDRLEREHENLRRAIGLAVEERNARLGVRLGAALWRFWWIRGHLAEGREAMSALLTLPDREASPDLGRALFGAGMLAYAQSDLVDAQRRFEEALTASQEAGDGAGAASALHGLGLLAAFRGESPAAQRLLEEGLAAFRAAGDRWGVASALLGLGHTARVVGDSETARSLCEESLGIWRAAGDRWGIAAALLALGHAAMSQSDYDRARGLYEESLGHRRALGDLLGMAATLPGLSRAAAAQGDYAAAARLCQEGLEVSRTLGDRHGCADSLLGLGRIAISQGEYENAEARLTQSLALFREQLVRRGEADALMELGRLALVQGELARARRLSQEGLALLRDLGASRGVAWALIQMATVARQQGDHDLARTLLQESLPALRETSTKSGVGAALLNLGCSERDAGDVHLAAGYFLEALAIFQRLGRSRDCAVCLVAAATLLAPIDPATAIRLSAAGAAQHERMGAVMDLPAAREHVRTTMTARVALGEGAFAAAWAAGGELTLARAVAQAQTALASLPDPIGEPTHEEHLGREAEPLQVDVNQIGRAREVSEITHTEYFQSLRSPASQLRHAHAYVGGDDGPSLGPA